MDPRKIHEHIDRNMTRILQFEDELGEMFKLPNKWHFRIYRWLALYHPEILMGEEEDISGGVVFEVCLQLDFEENFPP